MPPKCKFTREEIIQTALNLTRERGVCALTARGLADSLGSSAKPIFGLFQNMEEVQREVIMAAKALYHDYLQKDIAQNLYPPYKASGMAYIRFAREEKELFRLLFMRDRSHEMEEENTEELEPLLKLIRTNTGLDEETARLFHLEMWLFVHGIAVMAATSYLDWDTEMTSRVLTDAYTGLLCRFCPQNS